MRSSRCRIRPKFWPTHLQATGACEETSGLLQDSSGNARHANAAYGTHLYSQVGAVDNAIFWGGTESFSVPDSGFDFGDVFTVEGWIKRTRTGASDMICAKFINAYALYINASNKAELDRHGVVGLVQSTTTITDFTTWHHIVATKNGATSAIYIDGADVSDPMANSTCTDTTSELWIGEDNAGTIAIAYLDEVAVYPTALSAARVLAHYNAAFVEMQSFYVSRRRSWR